jgi:putative ABC transport system permease protein
MLNNFEMMIWHYLKTTWRHTRRNRLNSFFKVLGLTLSLTSIVIITMYVSYQLSFDRFFKDYKNIKRVNCYKQQGGEIKSFAMVPEALGQALQTGCPEIQAFTRMGVSSSALLSNDGKLHRVSGLVSVDSTFFQVFSFGFLKGNENALFNPGNIVLTKSCAKILFGDEDPMSQIISFPERNNKLFQVSGIIEDIPSNSHLNIHAIIPYRTLDDSTEISDDPWRSTSQLFVLLDKKADKSNFLSKAQDIMDENAMKSAEGEARSLNLFLQPVEDIYLDPKIQDEYHRKGNRMYVYIFTILGIFLFIMAAIHYTNLSIADFHGRMREIGVRKILGARKWQIACTVITETGLFCLISFVASVGLVYLCLPQIASFLDPALESRWLINDRMMVTLGVVLLLLMFSATIYPVFSIAINHAVKDLKNISSFGQRSTTGNILLTTQFIIGIFCIAATLIIADQMHYIRTKDVGYDRRNLITLIMPDRYPMEKVSVLKNELGRLAGVESVSYSYYQMAGVRFFPDWYNVEINGEMKRLLLNEAFVDHHFFETMKIEILQGRSFNAGNTSEVRNAYMVNETAVKEFGWLEPLGKRMTTGEPGSGWGGTVIGVVKDFNTGPLREKIQPLVMRLQYDEWPGYCLNLRMQGSPEVLIKSIKATYQKILPGFLPDVRLVEDLYDRQYEEEKKAFSALQFSTWVVIFISFFGVFSLSLFMATKRMKEFGIRKVLGATIKEIIILHSRHFMLLTLLANLISLPLAWWLMREWLNGFAYKVEPGLLTYLLVILSSFVIAGIASFYPSLKAARTNPVETLLRSQ